MPTKGDNLSYAYNKRRGEIKKALGKSKKSGYWQLINTVFTTKKGKKKSGYRSVWYGIVTEQPT
jgi:hypothetical protein